MPNISIVIPTYNRAQYICDAVDSALSQTYKDYEIIVVDDGSTDTTKRTLKKYSGKLKYIYQENGGAASARNTGIKLAHGEYIAFLDADDIWLPEILEKQIAAIQEEGIGLVYTAKYVMDVEGNLTGDVRPHKPALNRMDLLNNFHISMTAMLKKDIVLEAGMFDTDLPLAQDHDLWIRVAKLAKIKFLEEPLVKYRIHGSNISSNCEQRYTDRIRFLTKAFNDKDIAVPEAFKKRRLAEEHYRLAREQSKKNKHKEALSSLVKAFGHDLLLGRYFIEQNDGIGLKIKKIINPYAALLVYSAKVALKPKRN